MPNYRFSTKVILIELEEFYCLSVDCSNTEESALQYFIDISIKKIKNSKPCNIIINCDQITDVDLTNAAKFLSLLVSSETSLPANTKIKVHNSIRFTAEDIQRVVDSIKSNKSNKKYSIDYSHSDEISSQVSLRDNAIENSASFRPRFSL